MKQQLENIRLEALAALEAAEAKISELQAAADQEAADKAAAIRSYMTAGSNVDWPQEEISPNL